MSRKRSSELSVRDNKVETSSGVLLELEDSRDKERLAVSPGLTKSLSETEGEKHDFDEITQGFSAGIYTVSKLAGMFIIQYVYVYLLFDIKR